MRRGRHIAGLVLGTFSAGLTVLPWLHTLHHRLDHVHVDGAIVFVGDHDHEHHDDDDDDDDDGTPGFDHPDHQGAHGRGALAHGAAFILAGAIFVLPSPAAALDTNESAPRSDRPALIARRSARVTRGPPSRRPSVVTSSQLVAPRAG